MQEHIPEWPKGGFYDEFLTPEFVQLGMNAISTYFKETGEIPERAYVNKDVNGKVTVLIRFPRLEEEVKNEP